MDLHFPENLVLQSLLHYLRLEEDFEGQNEIIFLELSQVHTVKFPFNQSMPDFKVIDGEMLPEQIEEMTLSQRLGRVRGPQLLPFLIHWVVVFHRENSILDALSNAPLAQLLFNWSHFLSFIILCKALTWLRCWAPPLEWLRGKIVLVMLSNNLSLCKVDIRGRSSKSHYTP